MPPRTYIRRRGERRKGDLRTRVKEPTWWDPYWYIQGSTIEKMAMAEFVRRGIWFEHTPQVNPLPWLPEMFEEHNPTNWEPDFLFPQYKIWLEIQGSYFHTLPGMVESDAIRAALITEVGWKFIAWWEEDIRGRLTDLMDAVPEFYFVDTVLNRELIRTGSTESLGVPFREGGLGIDHLKGLRAALAARGRPPQGIASRNRKKRRPK